MFPASMWQVSKPLTLPAGHVMPSCLRLENALHAPKRLWGIARRVIAVPTSRAAGPVCGMRPAFYAHVGAEPLYGE